MRRLLFLLPLFLASPAFAQSPRTIWQDGLRGLEQAHSQKAWKSLLQQGRKITEVSPRDVATSTQARVYLFLGIAFFHEKHPSIAWRSFSKAFELDADLRLPEGEGEELQTIFSTVKKRTLRQETFYRSAYTAGPPSSKAPSPSSGPPWQVIAGSVSAVIAVAALAAAIATGAQAYFNIEQTKTLRDQSIPLRYEDVLMNSTLQSLQQQALTQSLIANVSYGVAGGAAIAAGVFFLLAAFQRPAPPASALLFPLVPKMPSDASNPSNPSASSPSSSLLLVSP